MGLYHLEMEATLRSIMYQEVLNFLGELNNMKIEFIFTNVAAEELPFHYEVFKIVENDIIINYLKYFKGTWHKSIILRFVEFDPESLYPSHLKGEGFEWSPKSRESTSHTDYYNFYIYSDIAANEELANKNLLDICRNIIEHIINEKRKRKISFTEGYDNQYANSLAKYPYPASSHNIRYMRRLF